MTQTPLRPGDANGNAETGKKALEKAAKTLLVEINQLTVLWPNDIFDAEINARSLVKRLQEPPVADPVADKADQFPDAGSAAL